MKVCRPQPLTDWHVQYRIRASDHIGMFTTPEQAIESACQLMDQGHEVFGIGVGPLSDSIGSADIARIYAMWKATSCLFPPGAGESFPRPLGEMEPFSRNRTQ